LIHQVTILRKASKIKAIDILPSLKEGDSY
jgi:hypothetical protein